MSHDKSSLWASGYDETVEVNQRALIDKVLARYSGEFTVFRELLQNSDDAQSTAVEIHFESMYPAKNGGSSNGEPHTLGSEGPNLPDLKTALVRQWTFKNNGIQFRDEDWNRLKKIAEGNPNEEKIGAFGVGFYSLFSITEEPFVTSGSQWMGFYWKDKKDQLFVRRGAIPPSSSQSTWTSFDMPLREHAPIPPAFDLTRFLASSITFMAYLTQVSVHFDDICLAKLSKTSGVTRPLVVPSGLSGSSPNRLMSVVGIKSTPLHIKAEVTHWVYSVGTPKPRPAPTTATKSYGGFFSSVLGFATPQRTPSPLPPTEKINFLEINETNITLAVLSADVDVRLEKKMGSELRRSTQKNPPSKLRYDLIYTGKDEYDASTREDEKHPFVAGSIFQGLRADLAGSGHSRVFIGHATSQTTGLGGHMSSRFIPTVERESIDFMDRNVAVWNKDLLYVGGFLARAAYELELSEISSLWPKGTGNAAPTPDVSSSLINRALHAVKFFTFHSSTPSTVVSDLLEAAFFNCSKGNSFSIISTTGVKNAIEVRLPNTNLAGFIKSVPLLPPEALTEGKRMIASLQSRKMIREITFDDVLKELRSRPLTEPEMIACLTWWISVWERGDHSNIKEIRTRLLQAAVVVVGTPGTATEKIVPLESVNKFVNMRSSGSLLPIDGPLPDYVLPFVISRNFQPESLLAAFPWTELSTMDWLKYVVGLSGSATDFAHDIAVSAPWAERVLSVLSRAWPTISKEMQGEAEVLLRSITCIPTSHGMRVPEQAYFANVKLFPDLSIVTLPSGASIKAPLEKVLAALGVRKHVDLQVVFDRMIKTGDWTVTHLIKYLVSVQSAISPVEMQRLQLTPAFAPEQGPDHPDASAGSRRYRANELYEPSEIHRQLGLPIIDWGTSPKWRGTSDEAKFLFRIGLRRFPPLEDLIKLCTCPDPGIRTIAFAHLVNHIPDPYNDYNPTNFSKLAFVPAIRDGKECMGTPTEVYSGQEWAAFGLMVIRPANRIDALAKLKLPEYPPTGLLVSLLQETPPKDVPQARLWFGILAGRTSLFTSAELKKLSTSPIVPVLNADTHKDKNPVRWLQPTQCYSGGNSAQLHSKMFLFVDFGQQANSFLSACGMRHEPSIEDIVLTLLKDPYKFYELVGGRTKFLEELCYIALNSRLISPKTLLKMRSAPILLGSQRKLRTSDPGGSTPGELDEENWELQYDLKRPDQIMIVDDTSGYHLFGDSVFTAPQEDLLETFYVDLGSPRLSGLIKEDHKASSEVKNTNLATDTRALILERLPLFLHEHHHSQTQVSYKWLNEDGHFMVRTFGRIIVTKTLKCSDVSLSRDLEASAVAERLSNGRIQLLLAANSQVDMYEVSTSLCRLLLKGQKASDALLLMTILSTDLRSLKRRGYNVDRILKRQKAEQLAVLEAAKAQTENNALMSQGAAQPKHQSRPDSTPEKATGLTNESLQDNAGNVGAPSKPMWSSSVIKSLNRVMQNHSPSGNGFPSFAPRMSRQRSAQGVTPLSSISKNIEQAIQACAPENQKLLRNREQMQVVRENLNEGYCDISGRIGDLKLIGDMGQIKIYASQEVPKPDVLLTEKREAIARFIHVILPLADAYKIRPTTLHIFYDVGGGVIAFNRNGSIFLNLRYYEEWHDDDVRKGDLSKSYTSWFFTLAHEIAHNLVHPHNAEHEFYFSALCQTHITALAKLLTPRS